MDTAAFVSTRRCQGPQSTCSRPAIVLLANVLNGKLLPSQAADLLLFASEAVADIYGSGLGLTTNDRFWGHFAVNVAHPA